MGADEPRLTFHSVADITSEGSFHRAIDDLFYASSFRPLSYQDATFLPALMPYLAVIPDPLKGDPADPSRCPTDTGDVREVGRVYTPADKRHFAVMSTLQL